MNIQFAIDTRFGQYCDTLILDDNHTFTDAEIEVMKQERVTNWVAYIENPPVYVEEPVVEEPVIDTIVDVTNGG